MKIQRAVLGTLGSLLGWTMSAWSIEVQPANSIPPTPNIQAAPSPVPATASSTQNRSATPRGASGLVGDVKKMVEAGTGPEVVKAFIQNWPTRYSLTADDVLYLHDRGVNSEILTTLIRHSTELQSRPMSGTAGASQNLVTTNPPAVLYPYPDGQYQEAAPLTQTYPTYTPYPAYTYSYYYSSYPYYYPYYSYWSVPFVYYWPYYRSYRGHGGYAYRHGNSWSWRGNQGGWHNRPGYVYRGTPGRSYPGSGYSGYRGGNGRTYPVATSPGRSFSGSGHSFGMRSPGMSRPGFSGQIRGGSGGGHYGGGGARSGGGGHFGGGRR